MSQVHYGQGTRFVISLETRKRLESVRPYAHSLTRRPQGPPEELLDASHTTSTRGAPDDGFCGSLVSVLDDLHDSVWTVLAPL